MDIDTEPTTKPISDDQELAKVLAGVSQTTNNLDFEETPLSVPSIPDNDTDTPEPVVSSPAPEPIGYNPPAEASVDNDNETLDDIKKDALNELRPLVDKLDLSPEEKFDTYLLLIRSTDDKALIAPAHEAARSIPDETRRAQALLDVIKEIDYLSNPQQ